MATKFNADDLPAAGLGLLGAVLGAAGILGVVRPSEAGMGLPTAALAFAGLACGVVGLYIGKTRGPGRQIASVGAAIGLVAVVLFAGSVALDALVEAAG